MQLQRAMAAEAEAAREARAKVPIIVMLMLMNDNAGKGALPPDADHRHADHVMMRAKVLFVMIVMFKMQIPFVGDFFGPTNLQFICR